MKKAITYNHVNAKSGKARRGFCVLDREDALKQAVKAVAELRAIAKSKPDDESLELNAALHLLEPGLNSILQFSVEPFSDELFNGLVVDTLPDDVERTRKRAAGTVNVLYGILNDARADLSPKLNVRGLMRPSIRSKRRSTNCCRRPVLRRRHDCRSNLKPPRHGFWNSSPRFYKFDSADS